MNIMAWLRHAVRSGSPEAMKDAVDMLRRLGPCAYDVARMHARDQRFISVSDDVFGRGYWDHVRREIGRLALR